MTSASTFIGKEAMDLRSSSDGTAINRKIFLTFINVRKEEVDLRSPADGTANNGKKNFTFFYYFKKTSYGLTFTLIGDGQQWKIKNKELK